MAANIPFSGDPLDRANNERRNPEWIEQKLGSKRTVCVIHGENRKSIRVAEKLGYRAFARRKYRGFEAILFERLHEAA